MANLLFDGSGILSLCRHIFLGGDVLTRGRVLGIYRGDHAGPAHPILFL